MMVVGQCLLISIVNCRPLIIGWLDQEEGLFDDMIAVRGIFKISLYD
jgi:hypothetical protein